MVAANEPKYPAPFDAAGSKMPAMPHICGQIPQSVYSVQWSQHSGCGWSHDAVEASLLRSGIC
jgi:hypothetical protein